MMQVKGEEIRIAEHQLIELRAQRDVIDTLKSISDQLIQAANSKRQHAKQDYLDVLSGARASLREGIMKAVGAAAAYLVDVYSYSTSMGQVYKKLLATAQEGEDIYIQI